jgi:peptidoglycan/xylan/chitin deacetylase (PgdA/CDA1 family)
MRAMVSRHARAPIFISRAKRPAACTAPAQRLAYLPLLGSLRDTALAAFLPRTPEMALAISAMESDRVERIGARTMKLVTAFGALLFAAGALAQQGNQPGVRWTDQQLKQTVDLARVGRKLTPKLWPNGARVAVCLTFDDDTEAPLLRDGTTSPTTLSASDFRAESGTQRILAMLDHYQLPATFFVTGVDAMLHPDMVAAVLKSGRHEIGVHGWIHEFPPRLADGEEEKLLDRAIEYLTKATGNRPVGARAPSWAFSGVTLDLIRKKGFLYDSSLQALDEPYEIKSRGKNTGLVELAIDWTLTETPYLGQNGHMPSPELLYQVYQDEFDGAYGKGLRSC